MATPKTPFGAAFGADIGIPTTGAGAHPGTGPDGMNRGELNPNNRAANVEAGVRYQLLPAYPPFVRLAAPDQGIVYFPRFYTGAFGGNGEVAAAQLIQGVKCTQST